MHKSAALLIVVAVCAGCGGGRPTPPRQSSVQPKAEVLKQAAQVVADAKAAALSARSVHMTGRLRSAGGPMGVDVTYGPTGAKGTVTLDGRRLDFVRKGSELYLRGSDSFWRKVGGPGAVTVLHGRWIKVPPRRPDFRKMVRVTQLRPLLAHAFAKKPQNWQIANVGVARYDGHRVIAIQDITGDGSRLYVAAAGKPYPLGVVTTVNDRSYSVTFRAWNRPVSVKAPKNPLDLSKLIGANSARA
jgi:hypothetical protein